MTAHAHLLEEVDVARALDPLAPAFARANAFLLDGGGCSLFGAEPFLVLRAWRTDERDANGARLCRIVREDERGVKTTRIGDALAELRALLAEHAVDPALFVERPLPLLAGAVGYIGYEIGQTLERLPCVARPGAGMPDMAFGFHRWVIGRDHASGRAWLSVVGRGHDAIAARADAEATRDRVLRALDELPQASPSPPLVARDVPLQLEASLPRARYLERVREAKDHIFAGDAFEVCLTHAMRTSFDGDPWSLWRALRRESPAPFAALLDLPEGAIVSSSPERFLRLDAARVAESRPIKGTRPRGATAGEDERLARELATSEKDRAENAMIVDLVRNDLGRVCRFGSVTVPEAYAVERYATVHQLVSTIRGELAPEHDAIDLVRACFPPGSMTGAPKIEAMSILERLEPDERGPYAGALGYFDFAGSLDLSVVIRTIVVKDGRAHLHVGGAVVADSDPAAEHDETMHKARALVAAMTAVAEAP